ncbi:ImpA family metalloprotease [Variovorax sp. PCZ-1]|uniref:ImpA family metalloprotease n=1 Tax=Variovorax sp. PCZ-1 TaxID=2835533 RepID=UPI001BCCAF97|nr:ImpA family metalloprotease [Variovorax sp. PCZ-1]MBS7809207.1 ImpA family metalloprotease [Variovorax sp. PCZ-1]
MLPSITHPIASLFVRYAANLTAYALVLSLVACGGGGGGAETPVSTSTNPGNAPGVTNTSGGSVNTPAADLVAQAILTGDASKLDSATAINATVSLLQKQLSDETALRQAVFGASIASIDWDPSHDSAYFSVLDQGRNRILLAGNWRYKGTSAASGSTLAIAGNDPATGSRYAAFGGNPLAVRGNAAMDAVMLNTLGWLTGRNNLSGLKVVTAHLPSTATFWFKHEVPTRAWLTSQIPTVRINGVTGTAAIDDSCDGSRLDACLQGADLLVIGREVTPNSGTSSYNGNAVMAAVKAAQARGVAVLYLHHDGDTGDLAERMLSHFGLSISDNYWSQEGLKSFNPASLNSKSTTQDTLALIQRLQNADFSTTWSGCVANVGTVSCNSDSALQAEFQAPATALRSALRALDAKGFALFDQPGYTLEKHLVLLGDTYRRNVTYPMDKGGDKGTFFRAHFSDMTAYINRRFNVAAANQGSFAPAIAAATPAVNRIVNTHAPETGSRDYMTGLYIMPGRTITLRRTDASAAAMTVGINMLRDTTRVYNPNGYDRPSLLASPRVPLVKDQTITLTSPFGGPLYLFISAASGAPAVTVEVNGVITHPVLRNMNDAAEVAAFKTELASTPSNWVGISSDFLSVHSNVKHMRSTLAAHNDDMTLLANRIGTYMIKDTYELAGFNSSSGAFGLPSSVSAFCTVAGWDCTGLQHRRDVMQHVIADTVAACGAGCSGNPYDQNWALEPLGWGETHEIGHNLQRNRMSIYGGQSGEVSNNIFPIHKQMAFNRSTNPSAPIKARENSTITAFNLLKSSMQAGATSTHVYDSMWANTDYAADNSQRLNFYRQLVEYARHYNPSFTDGWELYTLIYLLERNFSAASGSWATSNTAMGFGTYASYPSSINGNDFMLIAVSRIIGRDMRPVWDLWGVTYTAAASAQVVAYGTPAADKLLFPMKDLNAYGAKVAAPITMSATAVYPTGF